MSDLQPSIQNVSFPKNLAYNIRVLEGSINKQRVKINSDRPSYNSSQTIRFTLPRGSIVDFRSLVIYATGSTSGTTATNAHYFHFPRLGLHSLIENLTISVNNITLSQVQSYNFLYNTLFDLEGGSIEQASKRCVSELYDPTVKYTQTDSVSGTASSYENKIAAAYNHSGAATGGTTFGNPANDTDVKFCANNFIAFLGSLSCPCLDLNDIGDVVISIQLAPVWALYYSTINTAKPTSFTSVNYELTNVYLTIDKLTFTNSLYYELKARQLDTENGGKGLRVGFYDYWTIVGSALAKSAGVSLNASINSSCLNQLIATFRRGDYQSLKPLVFYGGNGLVANGATEVVSYDEYLANPRKFSGDATGVLESAGLGDGFCQSAYFQRAGNDILGSSFSVNSVNMDGYSKPPIEIFNNTLQVLGYNNLDVSVAGLRPDCKSLLHFLKYYFADHKIILCGRVGTTGKMVVLSSTIMLLSHLQTVKQFNLMYSLNLLKF